MQNRGASNLKNKSMFSMFWVCIVIPASVPELVVNVLTTAEPDPIFPMGPSESQFLYLSLLFNFYGKKCQLQGYIYHVLIVKS